jgi:hypothetical protein
VTIPRVLSTSRMCNESTSHSEKKRSLLPATAWPSRRACSREASRAHTMTLIPNALP